MKAGVVRRYGPPHVVEIEQIRWPEPGPAEVLIRVCASTVSSADWRMRSLSMPHGVGLAGRLAFGVTAPRQAVLGSECSGAVFAVGASVRNFACGDAVVAYPGLKLGAHAEYCCMTANAAIAHKPAALSYTSAAALAFGGTTALDCFRRGALEAGERVLINGASGTVGSAMVQLAVAAVADVTAVCSGANRQLVQQLGATQVVDYTRTDFASEGIRYPVIGDTVGNAPYARMRVEDLRTLVAMATDGRFTPLIDSRFSLDDIAAAHARVETGRKCGSVLVCQRHVAAPCAAVTMLSNRVSKSIHMRTVVFALAVMMASPHQARAQYAAQDSTFKRYFVGSTLFMLANLVPDNNPPEMTYLNVGYRITGHDVVSLEFKTWRYGWPIGIPYGSKFEAEGEGFPGHIREHGVSLNYQRFFRKRWFGQVDVMPAWQTFVDDSDVKIDKGFQVFNTYSIGYHVRLFRDRVFFQPSIAITHRPYQSRMPDAFKQVDDRWPRFFYGQPGLHFGFNF